MRHTPNPLGFIKPRDRHSCASSHSALAGAGLLVGFDDHKGTSLVSHNLPSVKLWWLSWIASLPGTCLNIASIKICSKVFPGTEMDLPCCEPRWSSEPVPLLCVFRQYNLGFTVPWKIRIKTCQHLEKLQQWQNCTYQWQPKHSLVRMAGFGVWINFKVYLDDQFF